MAQTTSATSARNAVLEFSTNGSSWTDCSGFANKIDLDGGDRETGTAPTFDGDTMILTAGKRKTIKVKVSAVYTEGGSDLFKTALTAWQAASAFYFRWSVKAATTGNFRYTTSSGYVVNCVIPKTDIEKGDPVMVEIELETPEITQAAIP